jgi:uncharacterized protein (TIGR02588 family)
MKSRPGPNPSAAERLTLVVSFLVVALLIAVALYEEVRIEGSEHGTLDVTFHTDDTDFRDGSYYVPYTVFNRGAAAIASAQILVEVLSGTDVVESDEITVQFLPLEGVQKGVFVTVYDPASHALRARLVTVQFP